MSLDTKQKRGSVISLGHSSRQWLAEPSGSLPVGSRISLLRFSSAVSPANRVFSFLRAAVFAKPTLGGKLRVAMTVGGTITSEPTLQDNLRANR